QPDHDDCDVYVLPFPLPDEARTPAVANPPPLKVYSRHQCARTHRNYLTLAQCMWPRVEGWIEGKPDGQYGLISRCTSYGYGVMSVSLWRDYADAVQRKYWIDVSDCRGTCRRKHEIIRLVAPGDAIRG